MAEILVSALLPVLFEKLGSAAFKKLAGYAGIHSEVNKWEASLSEIRDLLNDASQKELTDEYVKGWLNRLQHLAYDIDDVIDDLATDAVGREMNHEGLGAITSKVRKFIPTCCTVKMNRTYETALPDGGGIVGRQDDKERLVNKLLGQETYNQNFSVVPIVGMGGVGKTTLARLLYNDPKVKEYFKTRAWVCVSDEFDILKISKSIFENVTGENKDFADINLLQEALKEQLMEKRFLLVLDDVWSGSDEDWDALVRPLHVGAPGSKIIITTRKDQLLKKLGHDDLYHLQSLSFHEALSLFSQHALGVNSFDSHPMLRPHGEGIVRKCDGLPLALKALGRLLRTKTNEEEWKELLNNEILEDYMFDKKELILLWMAEGFLHQSAASTSTIERLGHEYFEQLLSRSFFQHAPDEESLFMIHDLINDLATSVAGDFFLRLDNEKEKDVRNDALEKHRHMSFVCEEYISYKKFKTLKEARNLRTFLATAVGVKESWGSFYCSSKILDDLLHELPLLRVLRLNSLEIYEVPESIGTLKHLRYLNLSQTKIERLPENICNLYNLQTLIVFGCDRLTKLPKNFSKLKNLRHFDISDTPLLNKLPSGISELRGLQTLSKIFIGDNGFAITKVNNLTSLHGKVSLKGLDKVPNVMHALEGNLSQKRISDLVLEWSDRFAGSQEEALQKDVLNVLKPHKDSLEKLGIEFYGGLEFPNWIGDPLFLRLTHVELRGCKKCTSIPQLGQLPSLKELFIQGMDRLKVVGSEILGTGLAFVSLEILRFQDMEGWELWSTNNGVVDVVFPCLQELSIYNCPNLVEVSLKVLPSLRILKVKESGHGVLRSLVRVDSSVIKLEIGSISGLTDELWGGVMEHLGAVEEVRVERCDEIRYLWESEAEACKVLVNIRTLEVHHCENLVSLGEKEEDNFGSGLISLRTLKVSFCNNMERCICPNSIETLIIFGCRSITSVSFLTIGGKKLKSLLIEECDKISENELGGGVTEKNSVLINSSMSMLNVVEIADWPNLKSVVELSCFIQLTRLRITSCPSLESFPDRELSNLTSLKYMQIVNCPRMDASFPGGFWPPRLCYLGIGGLKKPMSKWGPQHFPASLIELWLFGGSSEEEDDVSSFGQLSHLLPSSLTDLGIAYLEKLESLSMGLQHLTSLQNLYVYGCPTVKDLPESLLDSLLYLSIFGCPNIRCSGIGSYEHRISHIPRVIIKSGDTEDLQRIDAIHVRVEIIKGGPVKAAFIDRMNTYGALLPKGTPSQGYYSQSLQRVHCQTITRGRLKQADQQSILDDFDKRGPGISDSPFAAPHIPVANVAAAPVPPPMDTPASLAVIAIRADMLNRVAALGVGATTTRFKRFLALTSSKRLERQAFQKNFQCLSGSTYKSCEQKWTIDSVPAGSNCLPLAGLEAKFLRRTAFQKHNLLWVTEVHDDLSQIGYDLDSQNRMVSGLVSFLPSHVQSGGFCDVQKEKGYLWRLGWVVLYGAFGRLEMSGSSIGKTSRTLKVSFCNNMELCNCPISIQTLVIYSCGSITSVYLRKTGGQKLKSLVIKKCDKIWKNQLGGGVTEKNEVFINSSMSMLEMVDIKHWPNLKSIVELSSFIHLTKLQIMNCPSLESFPDHEFSNLTSLTGKLKKPMSKWGPQHFPTSLVDLSMGWIVRR
ncbi:hypothetical protein OSB04_011321 [Centaurea solstitialis]|uniref:Uncharacterized protein n=1 Tax=Centaurea solstitialis TaxID=347529 RepID=A0AA38TSA1_9ASTR|nr:hypothetical protein OSB04_011321 [Centaurea solstitialis]